MKKIDLDIAELKGVGKILDSLWNNCYYDLGEKTAERLEDELIHFFGINWSRDMYKLIEDGENPHEIMVVKTLKENRREKNLKKQKQTKVLHRGRGEKINKQ